MAIIRVRQHVNPLGEKYQRPVQPPPWAAIYGELHQPLHVDIGCGKGIFLLQMAALYPNWNFLGLEIRQPLVDQALGRGPRAGLTNLHFLFCNANLAFRSLMASWPSPQPLRRVSIQFPDPWFKQRHHKRRVLQPALVEDLATFLPAGGEVVIQSDVEAVARHMRDRLVEFPGFTPSSPGWLAESPFPAQTDRERVTLEQGLTVYRARFIRSCLPEQGSYGQLI
ncbi:MAG: tRNA (guanosine(46)-N7)-methyltransferase TrmB [Cyanobacteria bacterium REEB459]|nr:tRNA (guanosine(46)-N7)-methyltransferase TrmB [Cyanobacteria bacterium REEB459]